VAGQHSRTTGCRVVIHLPEARVDIEEHPLRRRAENLLVIAKSHDVDERGGTANPRQHLGARQANEPAAAVAGHRERAAE
jgi:hypothetical protein